ncbi:MAG TPA: ClpXP protease specificity-enhancing factor [Burkholderiales bacterium]|nr:ClpXP protease specificity-enhancing factor [Burkholderiales bacterium]
MKNISSKPYLIRALCEWCADSGLTPYLAVKVNEHTRVPMEYVKNGEIILNISRDATRNLTLGNELIQFSARFDGVSRELSVPLDAVNGVFAKENGQGLFFNDAPAAAEQKTGEDNPSPSTPNGKPRLQVVK